MLYNEVNSHLSVPIRVEAAYSKVQPLDNQKSHLNQYRQPRQDVLIMSSSTISVPPACPLVDVLMSSEVATERTAGGSGKLIHK